VQTSLNIIVVISVEAIHSHNFITLLSYQSTVIKTMMRSLCIQMLIASLFVSGALAFAPSFGGNWMRTISPTPSLHAKPPPKISQKRRKQLGINDDEDEYDLYFALDNNTDPFITKVIAGSLIVTLTALLVAGVVIPSLTDYGDGVCSPIQNAGRC
jgi:hypothetical protein